MRDEDSDDSDDSDGSYSNSNNDSDGDADINSDSDDGSRSGSEDNWEDDYNTSDNDSYYSGQSDDDETSRPDRNFNDEESGSGGSSDDDSRGSSRSGVSGSRRSGMSRSRKSVGSGSNGSKSGSDSDDSDSDSESDSRAAARRRKSKKERENQIVRSKLKAIGLTALCLIFVISAVVLGVIMGMKKAKNKPDKPTPGGAGSAANPGAGTKITEPPTATASNAPSSSSSPSLVPTDFPLPSAQPTKAIIIEAEYDDDIFNDVVVDENGIPSELEDFTNGDASVMTLADGTPVANDIIDPGVLLVQSRNSGETGGSDSEESELANVKSYALINFNLGDYEYYQKDGVLETYDINAYVCIQHVPNDDPYDMWGKNKTGEDGNEIMKVFGICRLKNSIELGASTSMENGKVGTGDDVETIASGAVDYSMPRDCVGGEVGVKRFLVGSNTTTLCFDMTDVVEEYPPFTAEKGSSASNQPKKESGGQFDGGSMPSALPPEAKEEGPPPAEGEGEESEGSVEGQPTDAQEEESPQARHIRRRFLQEETKPPKDEDEKGPPEYENPNLRDEQVGKPPPPPEFDEGGGTVTEIPTLPPTSASDEDDTGGGMGSDMGDIGAVKDNKDVVETTVEASNFQNMLFMIANIQDGQDASAQFYSRESVEFAPSLILAFDQKSPTVSPGPTPTPTREPTVLATPEPTIAPTYKAEYAPCGVCGNFASFAPLDDSKALDVPLDLVPLQLLNKYDPVDGIVKAMCTDWESLCLDGYCSPTLCASLVAGKDFCGCAAPEEAPCSLCPEDEILESPDTVLDLHAKLSPTGEAANMTCSFLEGSCEAGFCSPKICKFAKNDSGCGCAKATPTASPSTSQPSEAPSVSMAPTTSLNPTFKAEFDRCSICGGDPIKFELKNVNVTFVEKDITPPQVVDGMATCTELESYCEGGYCSELMCKSFQDSVSESCGCDNIFGNRESNNTILA